MEKIIIGLTGLSGSGKSEIANLLESKKGYSVIRLGKYIRELYNNNNLEPEMIEKCANEFKEQSVGVLLEEELKKNQSQGKTIVVDSVRTMADYDYFSGQADKFILFMVVANKEKRREWILKRNRSDNGHTYKALQEHEFWEMEFGLKKLMVLTDIYIVNDQNIDTLYEKITKYLDVISTNKVEKMKNE